MFAIVDSNTLEVLDLLDERPKKNDYELPLISLYIKSSEADTLFLPWDEWVQDPQDENLSNKIHHQGTILTQSQYDFAFSRQEEIKTQVQDYLTFAQSINGVDFQDLTTTQLKSLLALICARAGWIGLDGTLDLSDITIDNIFRVMET